MTVYEHFYFGTPQQHHDSSTEYVSCILTNAVQNKCRKSSPIDRVMQLVLFATGMIYIHQQHTLASPSCQVGISGRVGVVNLVVNSAQNMVCHEVDSGRS
uniref:Uncharacterized protein n=1 Tax=Cacopsylla melanoneura TaxID=428564 RepID=A0A8D8RSE6_9HEMI